MNFTTSDLRAWISGQTGLNPDLLDQPWFEPWMYQRLAQHGREPTAKDFRQLLQQDAAEMQQVMQQVAVPETWFFRYRAAYDYLADYLRQLRQESNRTSLRMLSIACASGEEAFSMAITAAYAQWPVDQIHVEALDWSEKCLLDAQRFNFSQRAVREDLPAWAGPWMQVRSDELRIDRHVAARINWRHANVLEATAAISPADYQVVFCRNLLVYLNRPARQELISRLSRWLTSDGRLFVGHADALELVRTKFDAIPVPNAFAYCHAKSVRQKQLRKDQPALSPPAPKFRPPIVRRTRPDEMTASEAIAAIVGETEPMPDEPPPTDSKLKAATRLADEGHLQDALALIKAISDSHDPNTFALQGSVLLALDRVDEAKEALRRALYLDPTHAETLLQLAVLHARIGDQDLAQRYRLRAAQSSGETNDLSGDPE